MKIGMILVGMIGIVASSYGDERAADAERAKPLEVKSRYHKRGDELLAEIDANMGAARQYSAPKDEQLAEAVRAKVLDSPTHKYDRISVIVNRGHVSLWGEVASESERKELEDRVRQLAGVSSINNQLKVAMSALSSEAAVAKDRYLTRGDQELIRRIREKMESDPDVFAQRLHLGFDSYDGIVTVRGFVKDGALQQKVLDLVNQVQGVRGTNNHLQDGTDQGG